MGFALVCCLLVYSLGTPIQSRDGGRPAREIREVKRYPAAEATQGVAVDREFFYAIGNHSVGKYDKKSGVRVAGWECPKGKPLIHLNGGIVHEGRLYCAHSNYPGVPMTGSIEIWDTKSMKHVGSHSFGIYAGSTAWIEHHAGFWYVGFAHYQNKGGEPNRDPSWTTVVKFDQGWNRLEGWVFPDKVIRRFGGYSSSGGVIDAKGYLYATGHDASEVYVLKFPDGGSVLELIEIMAVTFPGQGLALDRSDPGTLYAISKADRQVVVCRID
jgi:hypothetical protein